MNNNYTSNIARTIKTTTIKISTTSTDTSNKNIIKNYTNPDINTELIKIMMMIWIIIIIVVLIVIQMLLILVTVITTKTIINI